ncbi:MAG: ABC transporter permease [Synergistaceae bacterium]|jgi:peptide/nickel transport system permease protein|nr:ABC transporter permease [Synergistaceae bacterium]
MQQVKYIFNRILQMFPVLIVISFIVFGSMRLIPGDPAVKMLGDKATEETLAALRAKMGLDKPFLVQYLYYLKQTAKLDFGNSIYLKQSVLSLFLEKSVVTVSLTVLTAFFSVLISFPLGFYAGIHGDGRFGRLVSSLSLIFTSVPIFWLGLLMLMLLALRFPVFPVGGWGTSFMEHLHSLILPSFVGSLSTMTLIIRNIQASVVNVLKKDYVDFAYSKGLSARKVTSGYIMRNVLVSTVTLLSIRITGLLGGSVVIESVFALPGIGSLLLTGVLSRDYTLVQGLVFLFGVIVLVINLLTDISYSFLDPRVTLK